MLLLNGQRLSLDEVEAVAVRDEPVGIHADATARMNASRAVVERVLVQDKPVYGINTGFGRLSDVHLPADKLAEAQLNLIRSHACGVGNPLNHYEARALMLLRANVLAIGLSGARPVVLEALVEMLNDGVIPWIPEKGSVGASGDLAPLAHLALVLVGEGDIRQELASLPPRHVITLEAKEGLVLINGTQAMGAVGGLALAQARRLLDRATLVAAATLEALKGTPAAFDARIHEARPHSGQVAVAARLVSLLEGSQIRESHRNGDPRVQDAYSLRCIPQVHGAVSDALDFAINVVETESGSATDNPLVFAETGEVISGGNFHGAPLSYAFDLAAIVLVDLMSISERRIERLVNPDYSEGLPAFLAREPGISSGMMVPHVVAAALLNESKTLAHPASIDNVPTSAGKEDHVSMGMTGALKLRQIVANLAHVLAIEAMCACEGIEHRRPLRSSVAVEELVAEVRMTVDPLVADRSLSLEIEALAARFAR